MAMQHSLSATLSLGPTTYMMQGHLGEQLLVPSSPLHFPYVAVQYIRFSRLLPLDKHPHSAYRRDYQGRHQLLPRLHRLVNPAFRAEVAQRNGERPEREGVHLPVVEMVRAVGADGARQEGPCAEETGAKVRCLRRRRWTLIRAPPGLGGGVAGDRIEDGES